MTRAMQLLTSVRTALVLILLLAAATFAGTTLAQVPSAIAIGGSEYQGWVEKVRPRFGIWTDLLALLGLFNVFRSWWFLGLVAALSLSVVVCSIHRYRTIAKEVFRPTVRIAPALFERPGVATVDLALDRPAAAAVLRRVLSASGYRVVTRDAGDAVHVYADRNGVARFGTLLAHLSLVLLIVGATLGARLGWSNDGFVVPEGSTREVGLEGLAVRAASFDAEYYPTGQPKDFRSDVVLYEHGAEVGRKTVRVNDPLEYKGVRFYQSFFGPAAEVRVSDPSGRVVFEDGIALAWRVNGDRPAGPIALPTHDLTAWMVAPSVGGRGDPLITPGEMRLEVYRGGSADPVAMRNLAQGKEAEAGGLRFTFLRERQFTGLRVSRDPTLPLIWASSALLVVGFTAVLCFPYRRLWARVTVPGGAGARLTLLTVGRRDGDPAEELARLADEASRAVSSGSQE